MAVSSRLLFFSFPPDVVSGRADIIIIIQTLLFLPLRFLHSRFSPPYCLSRDSICCSRLHHPSHLCVIFLTRVGSSMHSEILVQYMCRFGLGMCAFLCSSCCVSVSRFLQKKIITPPPPLKPLLRVILMVFRRTGCIDVIQHSGPQ